MVGRKYDVLLKDADIRRWYENLGRGSLATADVYARRLASFSEVMKVGPNELIAKDDKGITDILFDFVSWSEKQGHAGSYIRTTLKSVRSWLQHNNRDIKARIKVVGAHDTPTLRKERVPTQEELKDIFLSCDFKNRVASILVAHSGLRIGVLGNYQGADGLTIGDFPELKIENGTVSFDEIPTMIVVRRELSKTGQKYLTFLGEEGCDYLKSYLQDRIRQGETLTADSPVITPKVQTKPFITATKVSEGIRKAIRKAGFEWRPYVLRSYFDTQLMLAESKGLVLRDYRQFWMGHSGDMESRYTTNKAQLPPDVIADMREAYKRSQDFLQTTVIESKTDDIRADFRKQFLLVSGYGPEEIEEMDISAMDDEEFQDLVKGRLLGENNGAKQKVVNTAQLSRYLEDGWEFVASPEKGKAVVKRDSN